MSYEHLFNWEKIIKEMEEAGVKLVEEVDYPDDPDNYYSDCDDITPPSEENMHRPMEDVEKAFLKEYYSRIQAVEKKFMRSRKNPNLPDYNCSYKEYQDFMDAEEKARKDVDNWVNDQDLPHGLDQALRYQMCWGDV